MGFYWSTKFIPELAGLLRGERRRLWRKVWPHYCKTRWFWLDLVLNAVWYVPIICGSTGHVQGRFSDTTLGFLIEWVSLLVFLFLGTWPLYLFSLQNQARVLLPHLPRELGHLCPTCGYDIRATPGKGGALLPRCPECSSPAESGTVA